MPPALDALGVTRGTYAVGLFLASPVICRIGALGAWELPQGGYLYVGSAWGPGGLRARVGRHLRGSDQRRWHIDYLRQVAEPVSAWLAPHARLECAWARFLTESPIADIIIPGFGASDCGCAAHLFYIDGDLPTLHLPGAPDVIQVDIRPPRAIL